LKQTLCNAAPPDFIPQPGKQERSHGLPAPTQRHWLCSRLKRRIKELFSSDFMPKKPDATTPATIQPAAGETEQKRFERILLRPQFKELKAVFDQLGIGVPLMQGAIITTNSYQMFLGKLGYRVILVKHIHENDCYARLGPKGGIRAVLPVHDTATYSTLVTLVNFDSTVTTTANSVDYYDAQLADFKIQLMSRSGNAG
jgi:hypothetical protein